MGLSNQGGKLSSASRDFDMGVPEPAGWQNANNNRESKSPVRTMHA